MEVNNISSINYQAKAQKKSFSQNFTGSNVDSSEGKNLLKAVSWVGGLALAAGAGVWAIKSGQLSKVASKLTKKSADAAQDLANTSPAKFQPDGWSASKYHKLQAKYEELTANLRKSSNVSVYISNTLDGIHTYSKKWHKVYDDQGRIKSALRWDNKGNNLLVEYAYGNDGTVSKVATVKGINKDGKKFHKVVQTGINEKGIRDYRGTDHFYGYPGKPERWSEYFYENGKFKGAF